MEISQNNQKRHIVQPFTLSQNQPPVSLGQRLDVNLFFIAGHTLVLPLFRSIMFFHCLATLVQHPFKAVCTKPPHFCWHQGMHSPCRQVAHLHDSGEVGGLHPSLLSLPCGSQGGVGPAMHSNPQVTMFVYAVTVCLPLDGLLAKHIFIHFFKSKVAFSRYKIAVIGVFIFGPENETSYCWL